MKQKVLITGSSGLIGSQAVKFYIEKGYDIIGIDNDMRKHFFGNDASTEKSGKKLDGLYNNFQFYNNIDVRDYDALKKIFEQNQIELIIHLAAQPSHDWSALDPKLDFEINANGTLNLLELTRLHVPHAVFIFTSTNKVYGDHPNYLPGLVEQETRYEVYDSNDALFEVSETMQIDRCKHSPFGASKVAADIMVQEYGKYFGLKTGVFRGGCLTGPNHAGAELHGFLSYLVKCIVNNKQYKIFGYKGKQVRDNIHSWDLVKMFWHFHQNPKSGEVYNAGGGRDNSISILEAIEKINNINGSNWNKYKIIDKPRSGDHIWYISDLSKFKSDYPEWDITISLEKIIRQMVAFEKNK
jgi:CDP-paratose 2-epimerase